MAAKRSTDGVIPKAMQGILDGLRKEIKVLQKSPEAAEKVTALHARLNQVLKKFGCPPEPLVAEVPAAAPIESAKEVPAAAPVESAKPKKKPNTVVLSGFSDPHLNTVYRLDADEYACQNPTYWSPAGDFFIYTESEGGKLQISPRWENNPDAPPTDMLEDARNGNSRGVAMEVKDNLWCQFNAKIGDWQQIPVELQWIQGSSRRHSAKMFPADPYVAPSKLVETTAQPAAQAVAAPAAQNAGTPAQEGNLPVDLLSSLDDGLERGLLVSWLDDKKFGFIKPDDGDSDIMAHVSNLIHGDGSVAKNDRVTYCKEWNSRKSKWAAIKVQKESGNPEQAQTDEQAPSDWKKNEDYAGTSSQSDWKKDDDWKKQDSWDAKADDSKAKPEWARKDDSWDKSNDKADDSKAKPDWSRKDDSWDKKDDKTDDSKAKPDWSAKDDSWNKKDDWAQKDDQWAKKAEDSGKEAAWGKSSSFMKQFCTPTDAEEAEKAERKRLFESRKEAVAQKMVEVAPRRDQASAANGEGVDNDEAAKKKRREELQEKFQAFQAAKKGGYVYAPAVPDGDKENRDKSNEEPDSKRPRIDAWGPDAIPVANTTRAKSKMAPKPVVSKQVAIVAKVPAFNAGARGEPKDWNNQIPVYWGWDVKQRYPRVQGATVDVGTILKFLSLRPGPQGRPVAFELGDATVMDGGWVRFPWSLFNEDNLPKIKGYGAEGEAIEADWQPAWHGCKFEALYSIMYHSQFSGSCDAGRGANFHREAPGAGGDKDSMTDKDRFYSRFVSLCGDGVLWSAQWEVRVDRTEDTLVHNKRSAHLAALWVFGCTSDDMEDGWEVMESWNPLLEADPRNGLVGCDPAERIAAAAVPSESVDAAAAAAVPSESVDAGAAAPAESVEAEPQAQPQVEEAVPAPDDKETNDEVEVKETENAVDPGEKTP